MADEGEGAPSPAADSPPPAPAEDSAPAADGTRSADAEPAGGEAGGPGAGAAPAAAAEPAEGGAPPADGGGEAPAGGEKEGEEAPPAGGGEAEGAAQGGGGGVAAEEVEDWEAEEGPSGAPRPKLAYQTEEAAEAAFARGAVFVHSRANRLAWRRAVRCDEQARYLALVRRCAAADARPGSVPRGAITTGPPPPEAVAVEAAAESPRRARQGTVPDGVRQLLLLQPASLHLCLLAVAGASGAAPQRADKETHCTAEGIEKEARARDDALAAAGAAALCSAAAGVPQEEAEQEAQPTGPVIVPGRGLELLFTDRPTATTDTGGLAWLRRLAPDALGGVDMLLAAAGVQAHPERFRGRRGLQHLALAAGSTCGDWTQFRKTLVHFPPPVPPPLPRHISDTLGAPVEGMPATLRLLESALLGLDCGMTSAQAARAVDTAARAERQARLSAEQELKARLRAMHEGRLRDRRQRTRNEAAAVRAMLRRAEEPVRQKLEEGRAARKQEAARIRAREALHKAVARQVERETEGRLRVRFAEEDGREELARAARGAHAAAAAAAARALRERELVSRRAEFRREAEGMRRLQARQELQVRVVERWRAEAVRLYLARAREEQSPQGRLDRDTKVLLTRYTLREEKRMLAREAQREVEGLRAALAASFLESERERVQSSVEQREQRVRVNQLRSRVAASRQAEVR